MADEENDSEAFEMPEDSMLTEDNDQDGDIQISSSPNPENVTKKKKSTGRRQSGGSSSAITLNDKYVIYSNNRASDFEHDHAEAFAASTADNTDGDLIAVVMKGRYPCRFDSLFSMSALESKSFIQIKEWGYVWWPDEKRIRFTIIFKKPLGKRIMANLSTKVEPFTEDVLRFGIIKPIFFALRELSDKGMMHGRINPMNIFYINSDNMSTLVGDGVSHAPGYLQPILMDTVERAMCEPQHKGEGSIKDDIYSLGMTVAILARGENPMRGKKEQAIIESKIDRGSYAMMTEGLRMTPAISEMLRGCLTDDANQRWGIEELSAWVDGTRAAAKQKSASKKAARALEYNGKKYWRPRSLAVDLPQSPVDAVELIEGGALTQWLSRALSSQELAEGINEAITRAQMNGRGEGYAERLITYVAMVLDPMAPIRFRGMNILPRGIGWGMAHAYAEGESVQNYGEMIRDRYAWTWLGFKENMSLDTHDLLRKFDSCSKMISRRGLEFGIERCLYELSYNAPCMSERLENYYVLDCEDLLKGLDDIGQYEEANLTRNITEKHVMSFISCRDRKDVSGIYRLIETPNKMKHSLAVITLFRDLQLRYHRNPMPGLTKWLAKYCDPIVNRFHRRSTRQEIRDKLDKTIKTGDLNRLINLIDNPANVKRDEYEFQRAKKEFVEIEYEKETLKTKVNSEKMYGKETGRQFAAIVSGVLAAILVAAVMMMKVTVH